jgi:hypothetical protein
MTHRGRWIPPVRERVSMLSVTRMKTLMARSRQAGAQGGRLVIRRKRYLGGEYFRRAMAILERSKRSNTARLEPIDYCTVLA